MIHKITAKDLARGAVTSNAIARGAVTAGKIKKSAVIAAKLAKGSFTATAIPANAMTRTAITPGSVYGGALGPQTIHLTPIIDRDAVPSNPEWTGSNTETAMCAPGEALLGTGFMFTEPDNREVSSLRAAPFLGGALPNGVSGHISSNSGSTAQRALKSLRWR